MKKISFVIPCYRSAKTVGHVTDEIENTIERLGGYEWEIILINDCSPDNTWEVIEALSRKNGRIFGVNLSKNFGQHAALMAGFQYASGDIVMCLDDDGQTPADEMDKLLSELEAGRDVVYAKYDHKKHSAFRNFGSWINELMAQYLLGKPKELYVSSYFAAKRFVVDDMLRYQHSYPYVIGLVLRATKNISNVNVHHREREEGTSGYTVKKLLGLWFNGFTAFSIQPLRFATIIGTLCAVTGFLYGIYTVVKKLMVPDVPVGFSSMMSTLVFIGGMIMLMLGLIGEYIGRIYISINNSPQYVVRETTRGGENEK